MFPRVAGETTLRPLRRTRALQRLLGQCLVLPAPLDEAKVLRLVRWMRGLYCYELSMSSLSEAVRLLEEAASRDSGDGSCNTRINHRLKGSQR